MCNHAGYSRLITSEFMTAVISLLHRRQPELGIFPAGQCPCIYIYVCVCVSGGVTEDREESLYTPVASIMTLQYFTSCYSTVTIMFVCVHACVLRSGAKQNVVLRDVPKRLTPEVEASG